MSNTAEILFYRHEVLEACALLRNQATVLVSGHFNVIHPGHKRFIEYAKSQGDILAVGLQSDDYLSKTTVNEVFFREMERANNISSLQEVNYVFILNHLSLLELIQELEPKAYVLGAEYRDGLFDKVAPYVEKAKQIGARVLYHSGRIYYSGSALLKSDAELLHQKKIDAFKTACVRRNVDLTDLVGRIRRFSDTKVLVVGDTIVDQYVACDPLGMSSEAPVIALKEIEKREFVGGAAIVACHLKALGMNTYFLSVLGSDSAGMFVRNELDKRNIASVLLTDKERPTTFKIRYMVETQKMLRVSRLEEKNIPPAFEAAVVRSLEELIPEMDGVIVSDFVYGVVTPRVLDAIRELSIKHKVKLFGDLQCSSQTGSILKFNGFSTLTPTEREVRIALLDKDAGIEHLARELLSKLELENLVVTLGSEGLIAYERTGKSIIHEHFPALTVNPVDVSGAGDTLLATLVAGMCSGLTLMEAAAIGNCASAISVSKVGNIPISSSEVRNFIASMVGNYLGGSSHNTAAGSYLSLI
jgi:rfaE bifunctional protein kinase chain/domain